MGKKTTGRKEQIYMYKYKKEHKVGGQGLSAEDPIGMKLSYCTVGDLCEPALMWKYDIFEYRDAVTKKEMCHVNRTSSVPDRRITEEKLKTYIEYCMMQKERSVLKCPNEVLEKADNEDDKKEVLIDNKLLSKMLKKELEKKKERKLKGRKRKKKKKGRKKKLKENKEKD